MKDRLRKSGWVALICLLVLSLAVIVAGCGDKETGTTAAGDKETGTTATGEAKEITIGIQEGLSGPLSPFAAPAAWGYTAAAKYINDNGGINIDGEKYLVELYWQDNKSTAEGSVAAANDMVSKDIKYITGSYPSYNIMATATVSDPAGQLFFTIWNDNTANYFDPNFNHLQFLVGASCSSMVLGELGYLKANYPTVKNLVYADIDVTVEDSEPLYRKFAAELGFEIVGDAVVFSQDLTDTTPIAQKIVARKPDGVLLGNGPVEMYVIKSLRDLGFTGPILLGSLVDPASVLSVVGPEGSTDFVGSGVSESTPGLSELAKAAIPYIQAASDDGLFTYSRLNTFNAIWCFKVAMEKAQSLDPEAIAASLESMGPDETIETVYGPGKMGGLETYGIGHAVITDVPVQLLMNGAVADGGWFKVDVK
jgi:branched-chain amino acid transport system substrate-binding protein